MGASDCREMRINVGARICEQRKVKNLSQADLERRCGLARCRISWLEHGRAVPTIETLERIADALEIPAYRLLYDGDDAAQSAKVSGKAFDKRKQKTESKEWSPGYSESFGSR